MSHPILFSDTQEHFYGQLRKCIQQTIKQELSTLKTEDNDVYLKKHEVCKLLKVSKPTVDSHVANGYYKKALCRVKSVFQQAGNSCLPNQKQ